MCYQRVPSTFVSWIRGSEPQDWSLRDCNNNLWRVKIESFYDGWHFTDGWVEFVKDNMIELGDEVHYKSYSRGILDFRVLDPSGHRKVYGGEHLETRAARWHAVKMEVKEADDRKRRGKAKVVEDGDGDRIERRATKRHDVRTKVKVEDERPPQRRGKEKVVDDDDDRIEHRATKCRDVKRKVRFEDERPPKRQGKEMVVDDGGERIEHRIIKWRDVKRKVRFEDERPLKRRGKEKVVEDDDDRIEHRTTKRRHVERKVRFEDEMPPKRRGKEKVVDYGEEIEIVGRRTAKRPNLRVEIKIEASDDVAGRPQRKLEEEKEKKKEKEKEKEKVVDAGAGPSVRGKRKKRRDFFDMAVFKSGRVPVPTNPFFVVEVRENRVNEMSMPSQLLKSFDLELPLHMKVVDSEGREYRTTRKSWKDGRVNYCGGWRLLRLANEVRTGDKLICEFIGGGEGEGGDLHIRVTPVCAE